MNEPSLEPEHGNHQDVKERYRLFFTNSTSEETPKPFSIPKFLVSGVTEIGFFKGSLKSDKSPPPSDIPVFAA